LIVFIPNQIKLTRSGTRKEKNNFSHLKNEKKGRIEYISDGGFTHYRDYSTDLAALAAAAIPTRSATKTKTCAIVFAELITSVETADMNVMVAIKSTTAIAMM